MSGIIVTGGAGFIGSNFVRSWLKITNEPVTVVDSLTYAGNMENLQDCASNPRFNFCRVDITDSGSVLDIVTRTNPRGIVHFAAESHVDRSILDASVFVRTNVLGTWNILDIARKLGNIRVVQVSTDEVYGSIGSGQFTEQSPIHPNSPYAASKASADLLCRSAYKTYGQDVIVTRCSNNYGPNHFPEKFIPLIISRAMADQELPVYGDGLNVRDWIHVDDHCAALISVLNSGKSGEVYNIGAGCEMRNIDVAYRILAVLGKPRTCIKYVKDRLGHDRRYAIDSRYIAKTLGWKPQVDFDSGLLGVIRWYQDNKSWCSRIINGEYRTYYETNYGQR
jgi:dTDP-glucose 4,6-dehydratase